MQYEARIYERGAGVPSVRVDAGEWTNPFVLGTPADSIKTRYLLRALDGLGFDAVNVGLADCLQSARFYESVRAEHPEALERLLSANVFRRESPGELAWPDRRVVERTLEDGSMLRIGITGVASLADPRVLSAYNTELTLPEPAQPDTLETESFLLREPLACLEPVLAELRAEVELLVVLYAGDSARGIELASAFPEIDLLVVTNDERETQAPAILGDTVPVVAVSAHAGKEILHLTFRRSSPDRWRAAVPPRVEYVVKEGVEPQPELLALVEELDALAAATPPPAGALEELYAGARRCGMCHVEEYEDWRRTAHARATRTLTESGGAYDATCLECHVLGFRRGNGFWSADDSRSAATLHVQCESCHGPAARHAALQKELLDLERSPAREGRERLVEEAKGVVPPSAVTVETCLRCHDEGNDPGFDFAAEVLEVDHDPATSSSPPRPR